MPKDSCDGRPQWPCLSSSVAVTVSPFRNLTGAANQQALVASFTDALLCHLRRYGRGFLLEPVTSKAKATLEAGSQAEKQIRYLVAGSAQRGSPGTLRVNVRITDAATSEYLWARRYEFCPEEAAPARARIVRWISRELHKLLVQGEIRRTSLTFTAAPDPQKCLDHAAAALGGELRPELTAQAQHWCLAALAVDPRNVEALVGLARTCQELVSNPWWSDPHRTAVASDIGREMIEIALELAPGHADAHCVQGMLYSAAGELSEAARAFDRALMMDRGLAIAHGFAGYNAALLGDASQTLPAIERAMRLDRADRPHSIWFFFGGFSELLRGRTETSIELLRKSLERNPSYGSPRLFLIAALSLRDQHDEAAREAACFRQQYPECSASVFEQLWIERSVSTAYRAQILPLFERVRELGVAT
jgi:TolB-like protein/Tfp pilus assembly protein PilF